MFDFKPFDMSGIYETFKMELDNNFINTEDINSYVEMGILPQDEAAKIVGDNDAKETTTQP
ncbi:MAG: hypothetical protein HDR41_00195 [Lactobacillus sp.]|nr:hypothetical protein [Lactobacillus sp.]